MPTLEERLQGARQARTQRAAPDLESRLAQARSGTVGEPGAVPIPAPVTPELRVAPLTPAQEVGRAAMQTVGSVAEGVTLGAGDELIAAGQTARGALGIGERRSFGENLEEVRSTLEERPNLRLAGNIAGGLASGAGIAGSFPAAVSTIPRIAATSAAEGGLAGLGFGEGGLENRAVSAGVGAGGGLLFGFAIPSTVQGVRNIVGRVRSGLTRSQARAVAKVEQALRRDQITVDEAVARLNRIDNATLADLPFAPNVQSLTQAVQSSPGPGSKILTTALAKRQAGRAQRIDQIVKSLISGEDFGAVKQGLIQTRQQAAEELYGEALSAGVLKPTTSLTRVLQSGAVKAAVREVKRINPDLADLPDTDIRVLDRVYKRIGEKAFGPGAARFELSGLRVKLKDAISEQVPVYRKAVDTFSDSKSMEEALEAGKKAFTGQDSDLVTAEFVKNLTTAEKEMFLVGVARAADQVVSGGVSSTSAARRLSSEKVRRVLSTALGSDSLARRFIASTNRELSQARVENRVLGGSPTQPRQAAAADLARGTLDTALEAAQGRPAGVARGLANQALAITRRGANQLDPDTSRALAQLLARGELSTARGPMSLPEALAARQSLRAGARGISVPLASGATVGAANR